MCWLRRSKSDTRDLHRLLAAEAVEVKELMTEPLACLDRFVVFQAKEADTGGLGPDFNLNVSGHESARTAVAHSMLERMHEDVKYYAASAKQQTVCKLAFLSDAVVERGVAGEASNGDELSRAAHSTDDLIGSLEALRDSDALAVKEALTLLTEAANHVDLEAPGAVERTCFLLRRRSGEKAQAWPELLLGSVLSTR